MYDTVFFKLTQNEVNGVDFLQETPCYLNDVSEHIFKSGVVVSGTIGGLKVAVSPHQVKVKDGSLCKYYCGDNYQTMNRKDTQQAVERLSDELHLPMDKAIITRLDIAQNFIVKYPTDVYLSHLGLLNYAKRLQEPTGLYYHMGYGRLCFYDKNREQRSNNKPIPELYQNNNVLRYEQRYISRIPQRLNVNAVTGASLYNEPFYMDIVKCWRDSYFAIKKINDISLNFDYMKTKKTLCTLGILSLVEQAGGEMEMIGQVNEAQKRGELSNKQAFDLRRAISEACKVKESVTTPSNAITELDRKVNEATRYYR